MSEAVSESFEKHYLPAMAIYDMHTWRTQRYYNEHVDNFLKAYLPIIDAVYKSWAPKKDPGRREYIKFVINI